MSKQNNIEKSSLENQYAELQKDIEDLEWYFKEFSSFLPIAVCTVNPLGVIIDINRSFEELTGYQSIEAVGKLLDFIFFGKAEIAEIKAEILQKPSIQGREITLVTKRAEKIPVTLFLSQRKDIEGNFTGYFVGLVDITDFKELQKSLEEKVGDRTKELQEQLNELERFHRLTVGRELKMIELKKELREKQEAEQKQQKT